MDEDSNEVPDVKMAVQALMTNLFISTVNNMVSAGHSLHTTLCSGSCKGSCLCYRLAEYHNHAAES